MVGYAVELPAHVGEVFGSQAGIEAADEPDQLRRLRRSRQRPRPLLRRPAQRFSLADLKMRRLLDAFDDWAHADGRDDKVGRPERFEPTRVPGSTPLQLDLGSGEIRAVVWATGFRPDYAWLDVPVVDAKAQLRH